MYLKSGSFEKLSGEVEKDEAYVGGADKNKHHSKKLKTLTGKGAQGFGSVTGVRKGTEQLACFSFKRYD
jgi:hypothetical protein